MNTVARINQIQTIRLAGRAARLFRVWGNKDLAKLAQDRKIELQIQMRGGRAKYNHQ
jgi:hypothetical protein